MTVSIQAQAAEYSSLGNDPDLHELVEEYISEMPDRLAAFGAAFKSGDLELLRRTTHQMKGAAGSYGFNQVTPYAAKLESAIVDNRPIDEICKLLDELLGMCLRLRAGSPD